MQFIGVRQAKTMSYSQLLDMKNVLTNELARAKLRQQEAKSIAMSENRYLPADQWMALEKEITNYGIQIRNIDTEISKRNLAEKALNLELPQMFIDCAREYLDEYDFKNIMEMAKQSVGTPPSERRA